MVQDMLNQRMNDDTASSFSCSVAKDTVIMDVDNSETDARTVRFSCCAPLSEEGEGNNDSSDDLNDQQEQKEVVGMEIELPVTLETPKALSSLRWYSKEDYARFKDEEQQGENAFEVARACRRNIVQSILEQQDTQRKLGVSDPKGLEKLSRACSKLARARARDTALQFEQEAYGDEKRRSSFISTTPENSPRSTIPERVKRVRPRVGSKKSSSRNLTLMRKPAGFTTRTPPRHQQNSARPQEMMIPHKPVSAPTA
jgi:hypothetical protein